MTGRLHRAFRVAPLAALLALTACAPSAPAAPTAAPAKPTEAAAKPAEKPAAASSPAPAAAPAGAPAAAASPPAAAAAAKPNGPLKVGVAVSLSGTGAQVGNGIKAAVQIKTDEINSAGGIQGAQVEPIFEDDNTRPDAAVNAVNKLITSDKVLAVIGSIQSPLTLATMEVSAKNETPQLTPVSTSPKVTTSGNQWIFRVAITDSTRAKQMSEYLVTKKNLKNVGILWVNDDFGKGANDLFQQEIPKLGGKVVASEGYQGDGKDFTPEISKIQAAKPDALIIWGRQADGALIARQMQDLGVKLPVYGSDSFASTQLIQLGGDAVNNWYFSTSFLPEAQGKAAQDLANTMKQKYNLDADFASGQAYDAAGILYDAMKRASLGSDVAVARKSIRDELKKTKDYPAIIGKFSFDETGDAVVKEFYLGQIKDGKQVAVKD